MFFRLLHFIALASSVLAVSYIAFRPDPRICLDTTPQGPDLPSRAMVLDCNSRSPHQNWVIGPDKKIQSGTNTDYCLGLANKPENGAYLTEIRCDDPQEWVVWLNERNSSVYQLNNTDFCMGRYEGNTTNPVQLEDCDSTNSSWAYSYYVTEPRINMTIEYKPDNSKCLEATTQGAMLIDCSNSKRNWTTTREIGGKIYSATLGETDKCLGVKVDSNTVSARKSNNLIEMSCQIAQNWTYDTNSGQYKYNNTNLCMDLYEGNMKNPVQLWDCDPTANLTNQKWIRNVLVTPL